MIFYRLCQILIRTCCQQTDVTEVGHVLSKVLNTCDSFVDNSSLFVDNKISIYFGEDKAKSIGFSRDKNLFELNLIYSNNRIKQYGRVEDLVGWRMTMKSLRKINTKLQFFLSKISF